MNCVYYSCLQQNLCALHHRPISNKHRMKIFGLSVFSASRFALGVHFTRTLCFCRKWDIKYCSGKQYFSQIIITYIDAIRAGRNIYPIQQYSTMVYYFKTRCGQYTIYMGKDKYENEDLIKYGHPEDCVSCCFRSRDVHSARSYFVVLIYRS